MTKINTDIAFTIMSMHILSTSYTQLSRLLKHQKRLIIGQVCLLVEYSSIFDKNSFQKHFVAQEEDVSDLINNL